MREQLNARYLRLIRLLPGASVRDRDGENTRTLSEPLLIMCDREAGFFPGEWSPWLDEEGNAILVRWNSPHEEVLSEREVALWILQNYQKKG